MQGLIRFCGRRFQRWCWIAAASALLAGCAAQQAFKQGQSKAAQGQFGQALPHFEEASRLEPGSAEYRISYLRARDRVIDAGLTQALQAVERGELQAAERDYRQVLALNGAEDRALQGLRQLDQQRRWDRWLKEGEAAAAKRDWGDVRVRLANLLRENPGHKRAQALIQQASEAMDKAAEAGPEKALAAAYRKPITIEFRDTPIKTVFEVLSRSSGLNFVFDKDVRTDQKASIFLKNSTVEAAIGMLLLSNQIEQRVLDANTLFIYPATAAKQKDYQQLTVRSFYLAYADAKAVAATLKTLLKLREPVVDEKLNMIIVRDSPEAIRIAEKVVALHDMPEAEVMLEVEILEVKRTRLLDLGVRWPDQLSLAPLPSSAGGALTVADLRNLNTTTVGVGVAPLTVQARKVDSDANILANPRIRARNREKAKIHIGERVPNITATSTSTGFVAETVNYVDVGLKLDVEPTVYLDNEVAIKVSLEVSNIINQIQTKSGTLAYQIGTRTASTVLRLKDGENQVLAGLINDEDRRSANKVPGLGEVPVLGRLFGNQADDTAKTEIVLSITPRILRNVQRPDAAAQQFESGTEANTGSRGSDASPPTSVPTRGAPSTAPRTNTAPTIAPPPGTGSTATPITGVATVVATLDPGAVVTPPANQPALPANTVSARWDAPRTAKVGDTVTVNLLARSNDPVTGMQAVIAWVPASVPVTGVTEGAFLKQGGATTNFNGQVDPAGQVLATVVRNGEGGATAEAALLTLRLRINERPASGNVTLQLPTFSPTGLQGRAMASLALEPLVIAIQ